MISIANKEVAKDIVSYNDIVKLDDKVIAFGIDNFQIHVNTGFVINSSFESDTWILHDDIKKAKLRFTESDLVVKQSATKVGLTIQDYVTAVKVYVALHFGLVSLSYLKTLPQALLNIGSISVNSLLRNKYNHLREIMEFLKLLNAQSEEIKEIIQQIEKVLSAARDKSSARELPLLESVGIFDEIIVDYWKKAELTEKAYYYPVYLWWVLTTVLPLRVTEFTLIPRECIEKKGRHYRISVRRSKLKGGDVGHKYTLNEDYELCEYLIPEHIAKEFIRYKEITKDYEESPIDSLFKLGPYLALIKKDTTNRLYDYYSDRDFARTLNKFYKNIVEEKYNYHVVKEDSTELLEGEIQAINLGDSRHLALINIVLSTNSVMLAKELARHSNVDTTFHYISNLPSVVKSQTYRLAKKLKSKSNYGNSSNIDGNIYESCEYQNKNYSSKNLIKVDLGWCASPKLRQGIVEDCMHSNNGKVGDCKDCKFLVDEHGIRKEKPFTFEDCDSDIEHQVAACLRALDQLRHNLGSEETFIRAWNKLKIAAEKYRNELLQKYMGGLGDE